MEEKMVIINGIFLLDWFLIGGDENDIINGFGGDDIICLGDGVDIVDGGFGMDIIDYLGSFLGVLI